MSNEMYFEELIKRVEVLECEIEALKRDLLHSLVILPQKDKVKSFFGSVRGDDVTEKMINKAKQSLFRNPEDL